MLASRAFLLRCLHELGLGRQTEDLTLALTETPTLTFQVGALWPSESMGLAQAVSREAYILPAAGRGQAALCLRGYRDPQLRQD